MGRPDLLAIAALALFVAACWLAFEWNYGKWYWRRSAAAEDRQALREFPTQEACMLVLVEKAPCGCVTHWDTGPPSGWACEKHMHFAGATVPSAEVITAWRARDLLRQKGLWK